MKNKLISLLLPAITLMGCNANDAPANGYPGPSTEQVKFRNLNYGTNKCSLKGDPESVCLDQHMDIDATDCGYKDLISFCTNTWKNNFTKTKTLFGSNQECQLIFPTKYYTFYIDGYDYTFLTDDVACTNSDYEVSYTDRFSYVSLGSTKIGEENFQAAFPYQGRYTGEKAIRISIVNRSEDELTDLEKLNFQTIVDRIPSAFKNQVWNYENDAGVLESFSILNLVTYKYSSSTMPSDKFNYSFKNECKTNSSGDIDENTCNTTESDTYFRNSTEFYRGDNGVSSANINVNILIVDVPYVGIDKNGDGYGVCSERLGEISTSPRDAPNQDGLFIYVYRSHYDFETQSCVSSIDPMVMAHEVGHALLHFHSTTDQNDLMWNNSADISNHIAPDLKPFLGIPGYDIIGLKDGKAFPVVDKMLLWPTAEGKSVTGDNSIMNGSLTNSNRGE